MEIDDIGPSLATLRSAMGHSQGCSGPLSGVHNEQVQVSLCSVTQRVSEEEALRVVIYHQPQK